MKKPVAKPTPVPAAASGAKAAKNCQPPPRPNDTAVIFEPLHRVRLRTTKAVAAPKAKKRENTFSQSRDTREDRAARQMKTTPWRADIFASLIPMSVQDETKARRYFVLWQGASEAHTRSGLQRASNAARGQKNQRISLILNANWN